MHEIKEKIEFYFHPEEFYTICLSVDEYSNLNWIHSREFILENHWYDIVKETRFEDGYCLLVLFPDHGEKKLISFLFEKSKHSPVQDSGIQKYDFSKSYFYQQVPQMIFLYTRFQTNHLPFRFWNGKDYSKLIYPPPRKDA